MNCDIWKGENSVNLRRNWDENQRENIDRI